MGKLEHQTRVSKRTRRGHLKAGAEFAIGVVDTSYADVAAHACFDQDKYKCFVRSNIEVSSRTQKQFLTTATFKGAMATLDCSPNDPLNRLLSCDVDRIWAICQEHIDEDISSAPRCYSDWHLNDTLFPYSEMHPAEAMLVCLKKV